jgi:stearoyl-CoA desaturase (Delta-9 desaturase)
MLPILIFFLAHWYLSLFTQSFFHHRYASHRAFTMSKFWEKVFFVLSLLFQGSSYLRPAAYGAMHRMHHAFADTEKDPHSPKFSKNLIDMMVKTWHNYRAISLDDSNLKKAYTEQLPRWDSFDKFAGSLPVRISFVVFYIWFYVEFATHWWMYFLIPIHVLINPVHGAVINWFAHKIGYRSHKMEDTSTNLLAIDFLMWGESYHNNHHKFPYRANFGSRWHEIDPLFIFIKLFDAVGIIELRKSLPQVEQKEAENQIEQQEKLAV